MLTSFLQRIDARGWPQRFVAWSLRRRARSRLLQRFEFKGEAATYAVCLSVASPLVPTRDLFGVVVPKEFGGWRDYRVRSAMVSAEQAVAVLEEVRSGTQFTLVIPVHADFSRHVFLGAKRLRLTCEAQRARLVTVRHANGQLLAAGTLELAPQAAYSWEWKE